MRELTSLQTRRHRYLQFNSRRRETSSAGRHKRNRIYVGAVSTHDIQLTRCCTGETQGRKRGTFYFLTSVFVPRMASARSARNLENFSGQTLAENRPNGCHSTAQRQDAAANGGSMTVQPFDSARVGLGSLSGIKCRQGFSERR